MSQGSLRNLATGGTNSGSLSGGGPRPAPPTGLVAVGVGPSTIELVWNPSADADHYQVSWADMAEGDPWSAWANSPTNEMEATGLNTGGHYLFKVRAVGGNGQRSRIVFATGIPPYILGDGFKRFGPGRVAEGWSQMTDVNPTNFAPMYIEAEGGAGNHSDPRNRSLIYMDGPGGTHDVVIHSGPGVQQVGPVIHADPTGSVTVEGQQALGLSAYWNVVFGRHYITVLTPGGRVVLQSGPILSYADGTNFSGTDYTSRLRTNGAQCALYVNDQMVLGPCDIPEGMEAFAKDGAYLNNAQGSEPHLQMLAVYEDEDPIVDLFTTPSVPSVNFAKAASASGVSVTVPAWNAGDVIVITTFHTGGGGVNNPAPGFFVAGPAQTGTNPWVSTWVSPVMPSSGDATAVSLTKTGGSANLFNATAFLVRGAALGFGFNEGMVAMGNASSLNIPTGTGLIGGGHRLAIGVWSVQQAQTIDVPAGFTAVGNSGTAGAAGYIILGVKEVATMYASDTNATVGPFSATTTPARTSSSMLLVASPKIPDAA